jgi:hypothetical protein
MLDFEELSKYYTDFIVANSNPYKLITKQVFKKNGEIEFVTNQELIHLEEINPKDLVLKSSEIKEIDYHPKSFFKRIFGKKYKIELVFDNPDKHFIFVSEKTKQIINTNCTTYNLEDDNRIILGERGKLVYHTNGNEIYSYTDCRSIEYLVI